MGSRRREVRKYFYWVNHYGCLYPLEDAHQAAMPFGPAHLKDKKFLDFFFKRLKATSAEDPLASEWKWLSKCGIEHNYVKASRTPIVFQNLEDDHLCYAGSLKVKLEPEALALKDGELYHALNDQYCLVATNVASDLFESFDENGTFQWKGKSFKVQDLT